MQDTDVPHGASPRRAAHAVVLLPLQAVVARSSRRRLIRRCSTFGGDVEYPPIRLHRREAMWLFFCVIGRASAQSRRQLNAATVSLIAIETAAVGRDGAACA